MSTAPRSPFRFMAAAILAALAWAGGLGAAQFGELVSPGPLIKAHASLEGIGKCEKCHEKGKKVSASRCLACHVPVAERMKEKKGVHRDVKEDCVTCHVEHAGRDADPYRLDRKTFDHATETGFALTGRHEPVARECARCHKTRSFLAVSPACATCHKDVHKGTLGADCASCHPVNVPFKETRRRFDHSKAAYRLEGAHARVDCAKCHPGERYRGVKFDTCESCHKDPHKKVLGANCAECHTTTESWKTQRFDHARSGVPLAGKHAAVPCARCHVKPATQVKLKMSPCAGCHADVHKGLFKQDCAACHKETGWEKAPFEHAAKTKFALTGRHAQVPCAACHKRPSAKASAAARVVDFRGLKTPCVACHADVHRGKLGTTCETCHGDTTFKLREYRHPRLPELFAGKHAGVACEKCHTAPPGVKEVGARQFRNLPIACDSCHKDIHLGQLGGKCETCHDVDVPQGAARFAAVRFRHTATRFPLTGKHEPLACAKCHPSETASFPGGRGTAVRFKGVSTECRTCHKDIHLGQLGPKCETCHGTKTFALEKFQHKDAAFFRGKHGVTECKACHKKADGVFPAGRGLAVRFVGLGACTSCHVDDHKGTLGANCASCHAVNVSFRSASRAFHKFGSFALDGAHLGVPCASCHIKKVTKGTPTKCYDCHWTRRQDDPNRTRLGTDCEQCHRTSSWTAVSWDHGARTGLALSGVHRTLACEKCHPGRVYKKAGPGGGTGGIDCYGCHRAAFEAARNPNHAAAGFPTACDACHRVSDSTWSAGRFDHARAPLVGAHKSQPCAACHKGGVFAGTSTDCYSCHRTDYERSTNPNHLIAGFQTRCDSCHQGADMTWRQGRFAHATFALPGVHGTQTCSACHKNNVYRGTPRTCVGCHLTKYQGTTNPNHVTTGFPTTCETCHKATDPTWNQGTFTHSTFTLVGVHSSQPCVACHKNGVYAGTSQTCVGCHLTKYQQTTKPNHAAAGFATTCETCHKATDATWLLASYKHVSYTPVGVHTSQACASCHKNNVYAGTPRTCVGCHLTKYQGTKNPNHVTAGFPTTCETCHKATDPTWNQGTFTHSTFTLVGVHTTQPCAACHKNGVYAGTARTCVGCHLTNYQQTTNPNHAAAGFPTTCETCHKATDPTWKQGTFNHATAFPLVGVHATQACASCHTNGVYRGTPRTCVGCHLTKYQQTTNPNHVTTGFPTTCETCHKATDPTWNQGTFNHSTFTLVGVHTTQPCAACHRNGVYAGTSRTCVGCHLTKYQQTTNPNHAAAGFATTCETCHKATDATWLLASYKHVSYTPVGVHATQACASCHRNNVYAGTPRTCVGCHLTNYQGTRNPNHVSAGFPTTCETCHKATDASWTQGTFTHSTFALLGVHATQPCAVCHKNGVYAGTSRTCVGCHLTKYQQTTNPNHAAAGFATTCETCHKATDATWLLASYKHVSYSPVGVHATQPCAACHKNNVYAGTPRTCVGCHLTNYQGTRNPNHVTAGFPTTCETCHRATDASWTQGTFTHSTFPLLGVHATQPCAVCHKNGVYAGTSRTCVGCHLTKYQQTTNPNHAAAGFPMTCETCHKATDATWQQGTFNHTWFPITSGKHAGNPCSACHTAPSNYAVFTCLTCHDRARMDQKHQGRAGYRYESQACYACHPQGRE